MKKSSFLIAGTHSGVGKTTASFILMSYFQRKGYQIQPFKHGPDFIDPGYHQLATNRDSINLDFWMMGKENIIKDYDSYMTYADMGIIESMGALFDGKNGTEEGSAAELASLLSIPIVLVVDISGMTRSVNALLQGFLDFDSRLKIDGIIFNRAGSKKHYEMVFESLELRFRDLSLGYLPYFSTKSIPERHLGLLTVEENDEIKEMSEIYLKIAEETLNLEPLIKKISLKKNKISSSLTAIKPLSKIRLGIAKDKAFCFYYRQNLNFLEQAGAELVYFSPINDKVLPKDIQGIYFGGGYPEVFAKQLSENITMKSEILKSANNGMPIYAECGGLIYLSDKLIFEDNSTFLMVGFFSSIIKWNKNYLAIRYVEVKTIRNTLLGAANTIIKGQEFHQTQIISSPKQEELCYEVTSSTNEKFLEGYNLKNVLASYMHLYFPSSVEVSNHFISQCEQYQQEKYASLFT